MDDENSVRVSVIKFDLLPEDIQKCVCFEMIENSYYAFRQTSKHSLKIIGVPRKPITVKCTEKNLPFVGDESIFEIIESINLCESDCITIHRSDNRFLDKFKDWIFKLKNIKTLTVCGKMGFFLQNLPPTIKNLKILHAYIGNEINLEKNSSREIFREYAYSFKGPVLLNSNIDNIRIIYSNIKIIPRFGHKNIEGFAFCY